MEAVVEVAVARLQPRELRQAQRKEPRKRTQRLVDEAVEAVEVEVAAVLVSAAAEDRWSIQENTRLPFQRPGKTRPRP